MKKIFTRWLFIAHCFILSKTTCAIDIQDLLHTDGSDNTSGTQQMIAYAKLSDIDILPEPDVNDSTGDGSFADLVTITQNVRMKPYKSIKYMYATIETGKVECKLQGEMDGKSYKNSGSFTHPGTSAEILGFQQFVKNGDMIYWFRESDGQIRQIGHRGYPAKTETADNTTGDKTTTLKGTQFVVSSVRKGPAPIFKGRFDLMGSGFQSGTADDYQEVFFA